MATEESSFNEWMKQRRRALALTQEDLSERVGCSPVTIQKIELGERRPSGRVAQRLAKCLKVPEEQHEQFVRFARGEPGAGTPFTSDATPSASPQLALAELKRPNRNNLPIPLTHLLGREYVVASVCDHLLRDDVRLLTLTGAPGIGKTRLSLGVAAVLLSYFSDGVYFVELAPLSDASLVAPAIASSLGLAESGKGTIQGDLKTFLRGKRMLLVLDNFEQVLDAATLVVELLAASPDLKALVTSREALHVPGEQQFPVPPLDLPDQTRPPDLATLPDCPSVGLFLERARAADPTFQLTDENALDVTTVCTRLDGLPLAIELAAARVTLLSMPEMAAWLDKQLSLLAAPARRHSQHLPPRHKTMRAAIEWSYELLEADEQQLLLQLGVFVGGWTLEAAEGVCGAGAADGIQSLLEGSMLKRDATRVTAGARRFNMLESIREYALEGLEARGDLEEMRRRHALYFLALAEEAEPELRGAGQAAWLDRLEEEHDNLRAVLAWSRNDAGKGDDSRLELGLRIGGALLSFWETRGHFTEGRAHLAPLLSRSASFEPTASRATALITAGRLAWAQGDLAEAYSLFEESLAIYRGSGDKLGMTYALNGLANTAKLQDDIVAASSLLEESLMVAREIGNKDRTGAALENLGEIALAQGENDRARELHEEGLRLSRELGDKRGIGLSLQDLGIVVLRQGDYKQARRLFEEALAIYHEIGEKRFSMVVLYELGQVARSQEDDARATKLFRESLSAAHSLSDRIFAGLDLAGLASVASGEGRMVRAARLFGTAETVLGSTANRWFQVDLATFDRGKAVARAKLGEDRWQTAVEEGRAMSVDDAVAYALELDPEPGQPFLADKTDPHASASAHSPAGASAALSIQQLTQREVEVLRLVAEGLTAPQVATRLSLSVRTVENHLRSIYGKLNVSTRAAATRIAVEHGLLKD